MSRREKKKLYVKLSKGPEKDIVVWNTAPADGISVMVRILGARDGSMHVQGVWLTSGLDYDHGHNSENPLDFGRVCLSYSELRDSGKGLNVPFASMETPRQGERAAYNMCVAFLSHLPYSKSMPKVLDIGELTENYANILMQEMRASIARGEK